MINQLNETHELDSQSIFGLFLHADHVGEKSFSVNLTASILRTSDGTIHSSYSDFKHYEPTTVYGWQNFIQLDELFNAETKLVDDCELTLKIHLELMEDAPLFPEPPKTIPNFEQLVNVEAISDFCFMFKNDDKKVFAHTHIITAIYPDFGMRLQSKLKDKKVKEIEVVSMDHETMLELMRFVYTGRVVNIDALAIKLLAPAKIYGLEALNVISVSTLIKNLTVNNVKDVLKVAAENSEIVLKKNCISFIKW